MVSDPFVDVVPKDGAIIPRGKIDFLKTAFTVGGIPQAPDGATFTRIDVTKIKDPDAVDVTTSWVTNELDPDDPEDVWNDTHADYVGDSSLRTVSDGVTTDGSTTVTSATANFTINDEGKPISGAGIPLNATIVTRVSATQITISLPATATATGVTLTIGRENIGLFHDSGGRLARKVKPPSATEITSTGDGSRYYTVEWKVLRGGTSVTRSEKFHVAPEGVLVFDLGVISVDEVLALVKTTLVTSEIEDIIEHAEREITGWLEYLEIDPTTWSELPKLVRNGTIKYAVGLVCRKDKTAAMPVSAIRQHNKKIEYAARNVQDVTVSWFQEAKEDIILYAKKFHDVTSRAADVEQRDDWHEVFDDPIRGA